MSRPAQFWTRLLDRLSEIITLIGFNRRLVDHLPVEPEIPDNVGELIKLDRFDDVAVHSECVALDNITLFTGGGENDNRYRSGCLLSLYFPEDFKTINLGQLQVKEDYFWPSRRFLLIGTFRKEIVKRLLSVPGHVDSVAEVISVPLGSVLPMPAEVAAQDAGAKNRSKYLKAIIQRPNGVAALLNIDRLYEAIRLS